MTTLEKLQQEIWDNDIVLDEFHLPPAVSMSHMDDDGDCYIAVDRARIKTSAEEEVRLLHEMGHCMTNSFYCFHTAIRCRGWHESRATRWAIKKRLPIDMLREILEDRRPRNSHELAEHLGLTVDFVEEALRYYTEALGFCVGAFHEN